MTAPDFPVRDTWWNADLTPDEFRALGYRVIDMIADYYEAIRDEPVSPAQRSDLVAEVFAESLPEKGQAPHAILDEWTAKVLPYTTHVGSPLDEVCWEYGCTLDHFRCRFVAECLKHIDSVSENTV